MGMDAASAAMVQQQQQQQQQQQYLMAQQMAQAQGGGMMMIDPATGAPLDAAFGLGFPEDALAGQQQQQLMAAQYNALLTAPMVHAGSNPEDRVAAMLAGKSEARGTKVAALEEALGTAQGAMEKARGDAAGFKARVKVLEGEVARLKASARTLLGKSEADDRLVEKLRTEVAQVKAQNLGLGAEVAAAGRGGNGGGGGGAAQPTDTARENAQLKATVSKLREHVGVLRGMVELKGLAPPPAPLVDPSLLLDAGGTGTGAGSSLSAFARHQQALAAQQAAAAAQREQEVQQQQAFMAAQERQELELLQASTQLSGKEEELLLQQQQLLREQAALDQQQQRHHQQQQLQQQALLAQQQTLQLQLQKAKRIGYRS